MNMLEGQELTPYFFVLAAFTFMLLLFMIRQNLMAPVKEPGIQIGNGQTIGNRDEQDDYFSTATTPIGTLAVLADGISGLSHGRMSSTLAVTLFMREFLNLDDVQNITSFFTKAARKSNAEIVQQIGGSNGGTTLVAAVVTEDKLYWGAVGDSSIMVFRDGEFINMNHKHILESVLEERYLSGEITKEQATSNPMRKRLINYLGYEQFQNMEICNEPFLLKKKDKVILLSDGVYNTLSEVEMEQILMNTTSPYDAAEEMVTEIERKQLRNQDNATVIILEQGW
ncbi:PP2C family protein-serine/threonine phosphatase [Brevibacillus laterosporus]|uniref:Serine/threonine protein phosphatase n=1 Tax=Brevibacillus laterosporus TaxID=1465 RepID=A0AAP8QGJ6_BRELA|nr:protein phosphatase 2C domain-containing protein [Brevibacillus laterosporus]MED1662599.1 protein phosphatase 2C domain-containing protein [Brevibacillus laterosporus]MED1668357.1 protein phosphatase 2C domain-containing protein [Brevibacillus laterosporus]MED1716901.1 protein phosphatase 2C domain-containing protein [Brevibacillus laterosporus]PPA88960.1 serine/threonine protein phosphatase [Brevibacillus laterosporus]PPB11055.1 serine/threonine protein phosphatase [Brevibacillus laterospo